MKLYKSNRCKYCDCLLWSDDAKSLQLCPECEIPDQETKDLEDQLEEVIKCDII